MINPAAIRQFTQRRLDDHSWIKSATTKELDRWLADDLPKSWTTAPLMKHQKACLLLGMAYPRFAFFLDMGTGKTLTAIETWRYWQWRAKYGKCVVMVPTEPAVWGWQEQIEQFASDMPYRLLLGSSTDKWDRLADIDKGMVIGTYQGITTMVSVKERGIGKKRGRMVPDVGLIDRLADQIGGMYLDESTFIGNEDSLYYRVTNQISKRVDVVYALAGRPFGRHPLALWSQMHVVDRGETFGANSGLFQQSFFRKEKSKWHYSSAKWVFNKRRQADVARMVRHRSIRYSTEECVTLPKLTRVIRRIGRADEMDGFYERVLHEALALRGQPTEIRNLFLRLRQISSGFMGYKDDETGEKAEIEFDENPKLDELMGLIEDMPTNRKAVVFVDFTWSGRRIKRELDKMDVGNCWIWSGTENYRDLRTEFSTSKGMQVMVLNSRMGAYSLNLQAGNYEFFFESPVSAIDRDQAERRCYRKGQELPVFLYDLVVRGTVDEKIILYHQQGRDLFRALMRDPELVLGVKNSPQTRPPKNKF